MSALLQVKRLSRAFGGVLAVHGVDLALAPGEVACIIGPNGAGKSTLLNMLCGVLQPSDGDILFEGASTLGLKKAQVAKRGIARKFQVPSVFETLTVAENLELASAGPAARASQRVRPDLGDLMERIELGAVCDRLAGELAHGQKQWLEIGMALATAPKLLLLDEPTAGMTPEETASTARLIRGLGGELAVLAIEHDIQFVRDLAARTIAMHQGKVVAEGPFEAVAADPVVREVYLGH
jgi:ABC-type uncharacterized transport system ATPase subunit